MTDNGDGSLTFSGNDIPPHDTWVFPRASGNPHALKESNWTMKVKFKTAFYFMRLRFLKLIRITAS